MSKHTKKDHGKTALEKKLEAHAAEETSAPSAEDAAKEAELEEMPLLEPIDIEQLAAELDGRIAECQTLRDQLTRFHAEFDNYRKRTARDTEHLRKTAAEDLIRDILPVADNLERALGHAEDTANGLAEGVRMVLAQLRGVLSARGLEPISSVGEAFNPEVHEALAQTPSVIHAPDIIVEEFQRGYRIGNYVLRPAKVIVSSGEPGEPQTTNETHAGTA
jgi:molecular chaperone GrpE